MVEEAASDYSQYFHKIDLAKEINPLCTSAEEMMARLEEFESLLSNVKADSKAIIEHNIPQILSCQNEFDELSNRIENLETFVNIVSKNVDEIEKTVEIAEDELGITNYSIKGLFKPLFGKVKNSNSEQSTNLQEDGQFKRVPVYNTSDYFGDDENNTTENN